MIRRSQLFIAALLSTVGIQAFGANVLVNPGFETGILSPWYQGSEYPQLPQEDWNVTNLESRSGIYSATNVGNLELRQDFLAVPASNIAEVSFWAKHPDGEFTLLAYTFFYSDLTSNEFLLESASDAFEFFDVTRNLDLGKSLVGFGVFGVTSSGAYTDRTYVDDFSIERVPEPATASAFLGAVFALSASRWRRRNRRG